MLTEHDRRHRKLLRSTLHLSLLQVVLFISGTTDAEVITFSQVGLNTWTAPASMSVQVLVVGGGGGGGWYGGGGGGGGGVLYNSSYYVNAGRVYNVYVGAGGLGASAGVPANATTSSESVINISNGGNGEASFFGDVAAIGGGGGSSAFPASSFSFTGGSGGGGANNGKGTGKTEAGASIPGQGYAGGQADVVSLVGGGGGGAGALGSNAVGLGGCPSCSPNIVGGAGGRGHPFNPPGSSTALIVGGGGGGGSVNALGGMLMLCGTIFSNVQYLCQGGGGGLGGGGDGGAGNSRGSNGTSNTGGGGGGGGGFNSTGGSGGSGVVIISYSLPSPLPPYAVPPPPAPLVPPTPLPPPPPPHHPPTAVPDTVPPFTVPDSLGLGLGVAVSAVFTVVMTVAMIKARTLLLSRLSSEPWDFKGDL